MKFFSSVVAVLIGLSGYSQNVDFYYNLRFENFNMHELLETQSFQLQNWPVKGEFMEGMPSRISHSFSLEMSSSLPVLLGLSAGYSSTGSRIYYEDFSGRLALDYLANRYDFMMSSDYIVYDNKLELSLRGEAGISYSYLTVESLLDLGAPAYSNSYDFRNLAPSMRLGGVAKKRFGSFISRFMAMYELDFSSKMYLKNNREVYLIDANGDSIDANWSGLKLSISAGYTF